MPFLMKNGFELYRDMVAPWTPGLMWILQGWFWLTWIDRLEFKDFNLVNNCYYRYFNLSRCFQTMGQNSRNCRTGKFFVLFYSLCLPEMVYGLT